MHSTKQGIAVLKYHCLITGKRTIITKLDKLLKKKHSDYDPGQTTDVLPVDAFEDSRERCLWKQVSTSAKMLSTTRPSAAWMRIFSYQKMNRQGSAICPIQAAKYYQQHKRAEIQVNGLLENASENGSSTSKDVVIHGEAILHLLRTRLVRGKHILTAASKDHSDGEMMDTDEILSQDTQIKPDSTHRNQVLLKRRNVWKTNPQNDKKSVTVSRRSRPEINDALKTDIQTTHAKLSTADEIKAESLVKHLSNKISPDAYNRTLSESHKEFTKGIIMDDRLKPGVDMVTSMSDITDDAPRFRNQKSLSKAEITVTPEQKASDIIQGTDTQLKAKHILKALMSENGNKINNHSNRKTRNRREAFPNFGKEIATNIMLPSKHHEKQANGSEKPVTSDEYANIITPTKQQMGRTRALPETDLSAELERKISETERKPSLEDEIKRDGKIRISRSSNNFKREIRYLETEFVETECTTETVISTASVYEESKSEPVDLTSEHTGHKIMKEPETPSEEHEPTVIDHVIETTRESTQEDIRPVEKETNTYKQSTSEPVNLTSETHSREHETTVLEHVIATTTEFSETECTTEIEIATPDDIRLAEKETTTYKESKTETSDVTSEHIEQKDVNEPVIPTSLEEHEPTVIDNMIGMTTEFAETECTTEMETSTPQDIQHVKRETTTYKENVKFTSENIEEKNTNEPETPSRVINHVMGTTTEFAETEMSTQENIKLVKRETTTYKDIKTESVDLTSKQKDTNGPVTPTPSEEHEPTVIDHMIGMTTEFDKTEIETPTPEDIRHVERETTTNKQSRTETVDLPSEHIKQKNTHAPVTSTPLREHEPTVLEHVTGTEFAETECTTEIKTSTPVDIQHMDRETTTYIESKSESHHIEPKLVPDEPVTSSTFKQYKHTVTLPDHGIQMTTEPSNNQVTTASAYINSITPARPEITLDLHESTKDSLVKTDNVLERTSMKTTEMMPIVADTGEKTESTEVTEILQSPETDKMLPTDEDGCFGLVHRTTSGLKRCQEKMMQMISYKFTPTLQKSLQASTLNKFQSVTQVAQKIKNQTSEDNSHFYYFNGKLKRVGNHTARLENHNNTYSQ